MKIEYSTTAVCAPQHLWEVFNDVTKWRQWNDAISNASWIEGPPWAQGSELAIELVRPRPMTIRPTVKASTPPELIVLTGKSMGVAVEYTMTFRPLPEGTTLLTAAVDLSGAATFFINEKMKLAGQQIFAELCERIKAEGEKLARPESPSAP